MPTSFFSPAAAVESHPVVSDAPILAVLPGAGGAGASTFAVAVAVAAAQSGDQVFLVDLDSWAGGLDLILGLEDVPGLRWPDLLDARGELPAEPLRTALPRAGSLTVLSQVRGRITSLNTDAVLAVLNAGRRGHDLVVLDCPGVMNDSVRAALDLAEDLAIVVSGSLRSVAAASTLITTLNTTSAPRVVVRRRPGDVLTARRVGDLLELPWVVEMRDDPRVATSSGPTPQIPGLSTRSPLRRAASRWFADRATRAPQGV
ncbi:MAG: septum site-determining protein Ssd [Actinomycetota bacterium]